MPRTICVKFVGAPGSEQLARTGSRISLLGPLSTAPLAPTMRTK
ncbi:MAG: hypothetical protein R2708_20740 [Vicinamibacterales bacterium]